MNISPTHADKKEVSREVGRGRSGLDQAQPNQLVRTLTTISVPVGISSPSGGVGAV